jgi:hypothetical protein
MAARQIVPQDIHSVIVSYNASTLIHDEFARLKR